MWLLKTDESSSTDKEITLVLQNDQIVSNEKERSLLNPGDILTYDKYYGELIEVLSVRGNLVKVRLPENFDRRYLRIGMHLFKIKNNE
jgi:hypothetical protein